MVGKSEIFPIIGQGFGPGGRGSLLVRRVNLIHKEKMQAKAATPR